MTLRILQLNCQLSISVTAPIATHERFLEEDRSPTSPGIEPYSSHRAPYAFDHTVTGWLRAQLFSIHSASCIVATFAWRHSKCCNYICSSIVWSCRALCASGSIYCLVWLQFQVMLYIACFMYFYCMVMRVLGCLLYISVILSSTGIVLDNFSLVSCKRGTNSILMA